MTRQTIGFPIRGALSAAAGLAAAILMAGSLNGQCITCGGYSVTVTPDGTSAGTKPVNTSGHTSTFNVLNNGSSSDTYTISCSGSGGVTCTNTNKSSVSLAASQGTSVIATYSVGGTPGTGTLTLTASGQASNGGSYVVTIATYAVAVTPDGGTAPTRTANTGGHSQTFTVKNNGSTSNTFSFSCSGANGVTCGSPPSNVTLSAGAQTTRSQTYSVGGPGTGTLTLTATGTNASNPGSYSVPIVSYAVAVTPDGATATTRTANTGGHSETFTVKNNGSASNTFSFACSGSGGVSCGSPPSNVTLSAGAQTTRTQSYSVGAPGTGTLTLTATGTNASNPGSFSVPIVSYAVAVTPDGATAVARPANTGGHSETFTVKNNGSASNTFSFACSGSGGVTCGSPPGNVTLSAGAQTTRAQGYSVGSSGTGTLTLTATGTNASNPGSFTIPIEINLTWMAGGSFQKDSRYLLQETADSYDGTGRITQLTDARGKVTNYQYGGNPNSAFLTQVTRNHDGTGADLVTTITYDGSGYVQSINDEGGTTRSFTYDGYGRLRQIKNHGGVAIKAYGYTYSRTVGNSWTFQPGTPNAVVDTTFLKAAPLAVVVSTEYLDGLGRPAQTVVKDGSSYVVAASEYDAMGRPWRAWKPYTRTPAGFDASFTSTATSFYNTYLSVSNAKPYVETTYAPDALGRVRRVAPEFTGTSPADTVRHTYGTDASPKLTYTETRDESGKRTRNYFDVFGNKVKTILGYGASEATTTTLAYDLLGRRKQVTDPRGLVTNYAPDTRGLLTSKSSPDAGTVQFKYDQAGNLRYSQDANQAAAGQVAFTTYDFAGRPLVSGQASATFSGLNPFTTAGFESTTGNWLTVRQYDAKPTNVFPWSQFWTQISPLTLSNVTGKLTATASKSNGAWQVTLFSYDTDGRVATQRTYTQSNDGTSVLTALNTTISYTRDLRDALTQRTLTVGSSSWYQWHDYNARGLLWRSFASTSSTKPGTADVTYTYRPSGQVQDRQFQGGPLVPVRYTIREQMQRIGDPATTTYPFSARYAYHANGTVSESEFYNAGTPATAKRYRYVFGTSSYDALNRLKSADFSHYSGGWVTTAAHDLASIGYDAAGNLTALQRYRETGTLIDNLTYTYPGSSNRLSSVADAINTTSETWDAEDGSFTYDANGNMKTAPAPYSISAVTYDHQNLPISLTRSGTTTTYRYNEAGQRITKQVGSGSTEVYLLQGALTLAVYTVPASGTPSSWYFNVLAGDKVVGRQPNTGSRSYYHTDLLGSTRSVTQGTSVVESYDYEPWGLLMPGRTLGSGTKEGFTSKERDTETGLDYFGARYYMPALVRWGSVDPLAEKHLEWSPYNYVLNNPLTLIDPDGRQVMANSNAYWEGVAVDGFQQGGFRGAAKVAAGMAAMTAFEFLGMNQAEAGFGAMAEGNWVSGTASVGMAVAGNLPGLNFSKLGKASGSIDDAGRAFGRIGDDAAEGGVRQVGGRNPINSRYAGETHPSGVRFTDEGFPDFFPHAKARVEMNGLTGNYAKDAAMANKAAGLGDTPAGMVWHHVEDGTTMLLVPQEIHSAVRHTGGAAVIRHGGN